MVRAIALIRVNNLADLIITENKFCNPRALWWRNSIPCRKPMTLDDENGLGDFSQSHYLVQR